MSDQATGPLTEGFERSPGEDGTLGSGTRVGRLVVLGPIGEGGMGRVYSAFDSMLDRRVCLKFLKSRGVDSADDAGNQRLLEEARALAHVSHPGILPIFDVGEFEGRVYLVTEFVDGWTLADWVRVRESAPDAIVAALRRAGEGLAAAHAASIVHRDFKPDNVMMGRDGRVRVMDFGLALRGESGSDVSDGHGTPRYMAPEQREAALATAASDQYAFCLTLVSCLGGDVDAVRSDPEQVASLPVNARVRAALRRGLSGSPQERYPSLQELLDDLAVRRRSAVRIGAVAAVAVLAALIAGFWYQGRTEPPCSGSEALVASDWNPDIAAALHKAFRATGSPVAEQSFSLVDSTLNQFAVDWSQSRGEACRATEVRHEQSQAMLDRRMLCFDRRLRERNAVIKLLHSADAKAVAETGDILSTIDPVSRCNDLESLTSLRVDPVAESRRADFARIDEQLAQANVQFEAGRYASAFDVAQLGLKQAEALDHPWQLARAHYVVGRSAEPLDKFELAEPELERAFRSAIALGDDALAARSLAHLMFIASSRQVDAPRAQRWIDWKLSLEPWFAHAPQLAALLDLEHGLALEPAGELKSAEALLRRAVQTLEAKLGAQAIPTLRARGNYANVLLMQGRMNEGAGKLEKLIPDMRAVLGNQHSNLASMLGSLATACKETGRTADALKLEREALDIVVANLGPDHSEVGLRRLSLAESLLNAGHPQQALQQATSAAGIFKASLDEDHPWRLIAATVVAGIQHNLGHSAPALATLDSAISLCPVSEMPARHQAGTWVTRARILAALSRAAEARADLRKARALYPELGGWKESVQTGVDEVTASLEQTPLP